MTITYIINDDGTVTKRAEVILTADQFRGLRDQAAAKAQAIEGDLASLDAALAQVNQVSPPAPAILARPT